MSTKKKNTEATNSQRPRRRGRLPSRQSYEEIQGLVERIEQRNGGPFDEDGVNQLSLLFRRCLQHRVKAIKKTNAIVIDLLRVRHTNPAARGRDSIQCYRPILDPEAKKSLTQCRKELNKYKPAMRACMSDAREAAYKENQERDHLRSLLLATTTKTEEPVTYDAWADDWRTRAVLQRLSVWDKILLTCAIRSADPSVKKIDPPVKKKRKPKRKRLFPSPVDPL